MKIWLHEGLAAGLAFQSAVPSRSIFTHDGRNFLR
jgi:hypothetical protein